MGCILFFWLHRMLFRRIPRLLGTAALVIGLPLSVAGGDERDRETSAYIEQLIEQADALRLHEARYWQVLMHYHRGLLGLRSRIDDPGFFLAPDGKTNPRAELHATLRAFFRPATENDLEHPVCRFIGRFAWLRDELNIDPERLPMPDCETYNQVYRQLRPVSATLVFADAYMNNPASMFGHTLITFDAPDRNRLLSKAVNYAAVTEETFGPFFAFAGIFGLYYGYYSIEPYHDKVEEYTDLSYRDMWEYTLDLTQEEVDRMVRHTWEMQNTYSHYFFFNENCSFNILYLIEAARPSLHLTDRFFFWVIPMDTVKLVRREGLIRDVKYRPSKSTKILHLAAQLDREQQEWALALARGRAEPDDALGDVTTPEARIVMMDLAAEYAQFLYTDRQIDRDTYTRRFLRLLQARSRLGRLDEDLYAVPEPERPEDGHGPARLRLGIGTRDRNAFVSLHLRPAYHEMEDPPAGYDPGAQIQFLPAEFRYDTARDRWRIERLDIVDIFSLSPRDRFFQPLSWKVRSGFLQTPRAAGDDRLAYSLNTGAGHTYRAPGNTLFYVLWEIEGLAGGVLDKGYAAGAGGSLGAVSRHHERAHSRLQARAIYFGLGDEHVSVRAEATTTFSVNRSSALSLRLGHGREENYRFNEAAIVGSIFF